MYINHINHPIMIFLPIQQYCSCFFRGRGRSIIHAQLGLIKNNHFVFNRIRLRTSNISPKRCSSTPYLWLLSFRGGKRGNFCMKILRKIPRLISCISSMLSDLLIPLLCCLYQGYLPADQRSVSNTSVSSYNCNF